MADIKWLYLHGFASGPNSSKGVALAEHYSQKEILLNRLDLRVPSLEHLRLSVMMEVVQQSIGDLSQKAILFGSSLGGLLAARVAEIDPRVARLVLLAPAFRLIDLWHQSLGEDAWKKWEEEGLEITDYTVDKKTRIDFDFIRDVEEVEKKNKGWPRVQVPTLIIHGRQDDVVTIDVSRRWAKGKAHIRLLEVDDTHELKESLPLIQEECDRFLNDFIPQ